MHLVYSARYQIDIGPHVFPTQKYRLVHDRLKEAALEVMEWTPAESLTCLERRERLQVSLASIPPDL